MAAFRDILAATSGATPTIVLSEGADPRVAEAAVAASVANLAKIICIGDPALVQPALAAAGSVGDIAIEDPATSPRLPGYIADYVRKRAAKGMTPEKASLNCPKPTFSQPPWSRPGMPMVRLVAQSIPHPISSAQHSK